MVSLKGSFMLTLLLSKRKCCLSLGNTIIACNASGNLRALALKFWSPDTALSSCFPSVERVGVLTEVLTWHTHVHPPVLNFNCVIIEMLRALGLLHVYTESNSSGLVCRSPRTKGSTRRKKSAGTRSRNVSTLKVNLCMWLTDSTAILAVVRSSLKAHQSENKVPYFHWPFSCILWPAHTVCAWVASKSC